MIVATDSLQVLYHNSNVLTMDEFLSDPINKEAYRLTTDLQRSLSGVIDYGNVCSKLKTIRCLLNSDLDKFCESFINCSLHSSIVMCWSIMVENVDAVEESLRCLLPLCKLEKNMLFIAEDMVTRGAHIFFIHALRRYSGRKNIKIQAVEVLSLLLDSCFANDAIVFPASVLETQRNAVLQEILIHGGVSIMSTLLVQFTASDSNFISLYRLLLCVRFVLFHGMTEISLKVATSSNFKIVEQFLRILVPEFNASSTDDRDRVRVGSSATNLAFDVDSKNMMVQLLLCFIGSNPTVIDAVCRMLSDNLPTPSPPGTVYTGLYTAVSMVPAVGIDSIPVTALETAAAYTKAQLLKLSRHGSSAESLSDLQQLQTLIDNAAVGLRKQEQQRIIGMFLQNVMKGKANPSNANIMSDAQLEAADMHRPVASSSSSGLFDSKNNNLVNDVKDASNLASNDALSREFWLQGAVAPIFHPDGAEPMIKRLQKTPLGRRQDPFRQGICMETGKPIPPPMCDDPDPNRPRSPVEQYISPTLEVMLKANPGMVVKPKGTGAGDDSPSKSRSGSPAKAGSKVQFSKGEEETQPPYMSPLEMIKQSPYLSQYSIDNIKQREEDKKKQKELRKKKTEKPKPKPKLVLPQVPLAETKKQRMLKKSQFNKNLFDVPAAAERLFEPVVTTGSSSAEGGKRPLSRSGGRTSPPGATQGSRHSPPKSKSPDETATLAKTGSLSEYVSPLDKLSYAERLQVMIMQVQKENTKIVETDENRASTKLLRKKQCRIVARSFVAELVQESLGSASQTHITDRILENKKLEMEQRHEVILIVSSRLVNIALEEAGVDVCLMAELEDARRLQLQEEELIRQGDAKTIHDLGASMVSNIMTTAKTDVAVLDGTEDAKTIHDMSVIAVSIAVKDASDTIISSRTGSPEVTFSSKQSVDC